jgi:5-methylcytosine-specific restriction endonuclease McrA
MFKTSDKQREANRRSYQKHRAARLAQSKEYDAAHRDERKAATRRRYLANKEKHLAQTQAWAKANPDRRRAIYARSYQKHAEERRQKAREREAKDRKGAVARVTAYRQTERGALVARAAAARRRARVKAAKGAVSTDQMQAILAAPRCYICGKRFTKSNPATVDHVIALANGGDHDLANLAPAHQSCNASKRTRRENPITAQGLLL